MDSKLLTDGILSPIQSITTPVKNLADVQNNVVRLGDMTIEKNFEKILNGILNGRVALFLEDEAAGLLIDIQTVKARSPAEPPTSAVIYGPRMGFTESIEDNISMLRKRLPTPNLVVQNFEVGKHTKTKVLICHLDGIASKKTVNAICKKIKGINIDGVLDSNYIMSYFQDKSTIFKRAGLAEKPDIVTAKMLEGRVAILVDGSPIALTLPFMIFEDLQNSNDYYTNSIYSHDNQETIDIIWRYMQFDRPGVYDIPDRTSYLKVFFWSSELKPYLTSEKLYVK